MKKKDEYKDFKCNYCFNILKNPKICWICEFYYCLICLKILKKCCNEKNFKEPHPLFIQYYKKIRFPCKYKEKGCKRKLKQNKIENHQKICNYKYLVDKSKEDLEKFLNSSLTCNFCDKNIKYLEFFNHIKNCKK